MEKFYLHNEIEKAIIKLDTKKIKKMYDESNKEEKNYIEYMTLFLTAYNKYLDVLEDCLNIFTNFNHTNSSNHTPLIALFTGNRYEGREGRVFQIADRLIEKNADVDVAVVWADKEEKREVLGYLSHYQEMMNEESRKIIKRARLLKLFE